MSTNTIINTSHNTSIKIVNEIQKHPFHLVDNSPWPLLISLSLFLLPIHLVSYFNNYKIPVLDSIEIPSIGVFISLITVILIIALWFRDVTAEGTYLGNHTTNVQNGLIIGILLFICSEVFFFVSIFWAYLHSSLVPTVELGSNWPPIGITSINAFELPLLNTLLLLSSGAIVTYSHHSLIKGNRIGAIVGLILTIVFAIIFTICQGIEYYNAPFTIADSVYGSAFYFGTGTHGLHVIIGTLFLAVSCARLINYHFSTNQIVGYESAIYYWHFVDIVWIILYVIMYWWGS